MIGKGQAATLRFRAAARAGRRFGRRLLERPEGPLLLLALVWTLGAKYVFLRGQTLVAPFAAYVEAAWPDLIFFAAAVLLFELFGLIWRHVWAARCVLLATVAVLAWSVLNGAWLIGTSVQLQPGVLIMLAQSFAEFWPLVSEQLREKPGPALVMAASLALATAWLLFRLLRPAPARLRRDHARRALAAVAVLALAVAGFWADRHRDRAYANEVVRFSSHWYALAQITTGVLASADVESPARTLPRRDERRLRLPEPATAERPNVVIVLLESISHQASSLGDPANAAMPRLEALAAEGVELVETRAPVSQTNKAFWAVLTGTMPDIQSDYAESALVDRPYESLASLLARSGYESAFFQMSKGSFGGVPGLFSNLGFDWAWFRENLEDESAHLGFLNGDDFRMIEPMFEWVDARRGPFLLGVINSISHQPYELPSWYAHEPAEGLEQRHARAVELTDLWLGELLDQLARRRLLDDTLICVLGDHGEGFRPEARRARWIPFEEVIRVPWVMRWPGRLPAGRKLEWPASQLDVAPTLLELLGHGVEHAGFDGVDALAEIPKDRRLYFSAWFRNSPVGFVEGDRKLVFWPYVDQLFEYDLRADPDERMPRTVTGPERERWLGEIRQWQRSSRMVIPHRRFRERLLFDHWRTYSSGRFTKAFYVP